MICPSCVLAGAYNAKGKPGMAEAQHAKCEWPESCTCQHGTGKTHYGSGPA